MSSLSGIIVAKNSDFQARVRALMIDRAIEFALKAGPDEKELAWAKKVLNGPFPWADVAYSVAAKLDISPEKEDQSSISDNELTEVLNQVIPAYLLLVE